MPIDAVWIIEFITIVSLFSNNDVDELNYDYCQLGWQCKIEQMPLSLHHIKW